MRIALLALLLLAAPVAAQAAPPAATLTTTHGSAKAQVVSFCEHTASGGLCADGAVIDAPDVIGTAGETVTVRIDTDVDSLASGHGVTPVRVDARTYTFPFPSGVQAPRTLTLFARHAAGDVTWAVELLAPDTPRITRLRLHGRRLSVSLACPARCDGTLTLRAADGRLAARFALDGVVRRTLKATVGRGVGRYLRRYSGMPVSARLSRPGRPAIKTTLRVR